MLTRTRDYSITSAGISYLRRQAELPVALAVTGGCRGFGLCPDTFTGLVSLFSNFRGALLLGSGQVVDRFGRAQRTVMEIGPDVLSASAEATVLGMRPTVYPGSNTLETIQHPFAPKTFEFEGKGWANEARERIALLSALRAEGWVTGLVVFEGGKLSYSEALLAHRAGHDVFPLLGSGRAASKLIGDFRAYDCEALGRFITQRTLEQQLELPFRLNRSQQYGSI